ncbi:MAG: DUF1559 domain-containing protein [Planctomycetaceae bacterium]|nr:DUF1559 domain-containing protein [Planctomycetaceae bacterium]
MRLYRCQGFTVVEVLVCVAVLSVLLALLLPAVQQSRASARRMACSNNLKQIGVALHNFESTFGHFPSGKTGAMSERPHMSWQSAILPQIERSTLYEVSTNAYAVSGSPFDNPPHTPLSTPIPLFACPEDGRCQTSQVASTLNYQRVALSSYVGVSGINLHQENGVLFLDSLCQLRDITDGTSNTLCIGERPPSHDSNLGWWYSGAGQDGSGNGDLFLGVEEVPWGRLELNFACTGPSFLQPGKISAPCDVLHFWSLHYGGALFLMCDGSVRHISYSAAQIMPQLASANGGEVIGQ